MSANIIVRPIAKGHILPVNSPSVFVNKLERMFGNLPRTITMENAYDKINTATITDKAEEDGWNNLLSLLERYGEVVIEI